MAGLSLGGQPVGIGQLRETAVHVANADCSGFCESPTRGRRGRKARRTSLRSSRFTTKHESVHDRATAQRTAVQLKSGGRRLLRKVISSKVSAGAQRIDESGAPSARIPGRGFEVAPTLGPPIKGTAAEDAHQKTYGSCTCARLGVFCSSPFDGRPQGGGRLEPPARDSSGGCPGFIYPLGPGTFIRTDHLRSYRPFTVGLLAAVD